MSYDFSGISHMLYFLEYFENISNLFQFIEILKNVLE